MLQSSTGAQDFIVIRANQTNTQQQQQQSNNYICSRNLCCNIMDAVAFYGLFYSLCKTCASEELRQHATESRHLREEEGILLFCFRGARDYLVIDVCFVCPIWQMVRVRPCKWNWI